MELLKFNDAPKNTRRGKNPAGFIGAGIMVAVMGLSSTLAGTITLNAGETVEFGQGVVNTAACDSSITLTPVSSFDGDTFTVSGLTLEGIGVKAGGTEGRGCEGQVLELRAYAGTTLEPFRTDTPTAEVLTVFIFDSNTAFETNATAGSYATNTFTTINTGGVITVGESNVYSPQISLTGSVGATTQAAAGLIIRLTGLKISPEITKFTIESRAPRSMED